MPDEKKWHYKVERERLGPFTEAHMRELIKNGTVSADTSVRVKGSRKWPRADETELNAYLGQDEPPPLEEEPPSPPEEDEPPPITSEEEPDDTSPPGDEEASDELPPFDEALSRESDDDVPPPLDDDLPSISEEDAPPPIADEEEPGEPQSSDDASVEHSEPELEKTVAPPLLLPSPSLEKSETVVPPEAQKSPSDEHLKDDSPSPSLRKRPRLSIFKITAILAALIVVAAAVIGAVALIRRSGAARAPAGPNIDSSQKAWAHLDSEFHLSRYYKPHLYEETASGIPTRGAVTKKLESGEAVDGYRVTLVDANKAAYEFARDKLNYESERERGHFTDLDAAGCEFFLVTGEGKVYGYLYDGQACAPINYALVSEEIAIGSSGAARKYLMEKLEIADENVIGIPHFPIYLFYLKDGSMGMGYRSEVSGAGPNRGVFYVTEDGRVFKQADGDMFAVPAQPWTDNIR